MKLSDLAASRARDAVPANYVAPERAPPGAASIVASVLKVAFTGPSGAGKTRAWRIMTGAPDCASEPAKTIGVAWKDMTMQSESGDAMRFLIFDVSGDERYSVLMPQYYREMNGYFAMFDMAAEAKKLRQDLIEPKLGNVPAHMIAEIRAKELLKKMLHETMDIQRSAQAFPFKGLEKPIVACIGNKSDLSADLESETLLRTAIIGLLEPHRGKYFDADSISGAGVGQAFSWMTETSIRLIAAHIKTYGYPAYTRPGSLDKTNPPLTEDGERLSEAVGSLIPETRSQRERRTSRMRPVPETVHLLSDDDDRVEVFTCAC